VAQRQLVERDAAGGPPSQTQECPSWLSPGRGCRTHRRPRAVVGLEVFETVGEAWRTGTTMVCALEGNNERSGEERRMRPSLQWPSCSPNGRRPTRRVETPRGRSGTARVRGYALHVLEGKIAVGRAEAIFILRISRIPGSDQRWQLSSEVALTGASIYSAALQNNPKNRPNDCRLFMLPSPAAGPRDVRSYHVQQYRTGLHSRAAYYVPSRRIWLQQPQAVGVALLAAYGHTVVNCRQRCSDTVL
jgi:hypothetical protein